jgi:hypothetical protein
MLLLCMCVCDITFCRERQQNHTLGLGRPDRGLQAHEFPQNMNSWMLEFGVIKLEGKW